MSLCYVLCHFKSARFEISLQISMLYQIKYLIEKYGLRLQAMGPAAFAVLMQRMVPKLKDSISEQLMKPPPTSS